jgi:hypothetical protein
MTKRTATLADAPGIRARLQAVLFHSREQRLARQGSTTPVPVISSTTVSGSDVHVIGTSVPGAIVIVYVDGVEGARTRANSTGDWSLTVISLAPGTYDFTATATSYGMISAATVAEGVVIV